MLRIRLLEFTKREFDAFWNKLMLNTGAKLNSNDQVGLCGKTSEDDPKF
jgi:hypothetical protein